MEVKQKWIEFINALQHEICVAIEEADGAAKFAEDVWTREEGGGGKTRIISNGNVFEKGGVNTSIVSGKVSDAMRTHLNMKGFSWFACGLSLVLHPVNPFVPTVHCNYRMLELYDEQNELSDRWFGGGTDLTPFYLYDEDAIHFHQVYRSVCDRFNTSFYPEFKKVCDDYFINTHRNNERRGIGGIFYDYKRPDEKYDVNFWLNFSMACGRSFIEAYLPIVNKRKDIGYNDTNKYWQEIRRGRYTEFNLIHDRGTLFGLKTNGRTESILMSLPPTVRFDYGHKPISGSEEDRLLQVCLYPKEWLQ